MLEPDHILITGDLTTTARPEFADAREGLVRVGELAGQGGRRQVAGDQEWSASRALTALDHAPPAVRGGTVPPAEDQLEETDAPLVEQPQGIERHAPDVDIREMDDPHRQLPPRTEGRVALRRCKPTQPPGHRKQHACRRRCQTREGGKPRRRRIPGQPAEDEREPGERSPGIPAWCASEKSKAEPVTASVPARTSGAGPPPQP